MGGASESSPNSSPKGAFRQVLLAFGAQTGAPSFGPFRPISAHFGPFRPISAWRNPGNGRIPGPGNSRGLQGGPPAGVGRKRSGEGKWGLQATAGGLETRCPVKFVRKRRWKVEILIKLRNLPSERVRCNGHQLQGFNPAPKYFRGGAVQRASTSGV